MNLKHNAPIFPRQIETTHSLAHSERLHMNLGSIATPPGPKVCALMYVLTSIRFYAPK